MSLLNKIFTAIRGGAREAGEAIVDKNSVRIFEQQIKDAENELEKAKRDLTDVMAKEMQAKRKIETLKSDITKHEGYAVQALDKGDEALALDVAQKIADIQGELDIQQKSQESFSNHVTRLKGMIKKTTNSLTDMQRQLVMVKTTESVQKATTAITENYASGSSRLLSAKESLDRIKQKQQDLDDKLTAGEALQDEFGEKGLEDKLKAAGIVDDGNKAQDILAQLKAKKSS
ncbi:PspA/IM30 family protein [Pseudomonadota bacterium]